MEKKLIYILNHYSPNSVQHFFHVIHLLECIADQGTQIALVVEKCDGEPEIRHPNISVYVQKETQKMKRAHELFKIVRHLVKDYGYQTIFVRISPYATLISCLAGHKYGAVVYFWQSGTNVEIEAHKPILQKIRYYIKDYPKYYAVKESVDYFVTGPEYMVDFYAAAGHVNPKKIRLLYNDIDTKRFKTITDEEKVRVRKELGLSQNKTLILFVHRLSSIKKPAYYIPASVEFLRDRSDAELLIIGTGPDEELLRGAIDRSGLKNVIMLGAKPNAIIQKYYQACDVFINPSYSEGFPRVVIEAMASGLPVVATAAGGTRDLFSEEQLPFLVDIIDRDGFARCLEQVVNDEALRRRLGAVNREWVKRYDTETVAKMYTELFWGSRG